MPRSFFDKKSTRMIQSRFDTEREKCCDPAKQQKQTKINNLDLQNENNMLVAKQVAYRISVQMPKMRSLCSNLLQQ